MVKILTEEVWQMPEQVRRQMPNELMPKHHDNEDAPRTPDVQPPDAKELLERMRRIDPREARRYRQRSGE